MSAEYGVESFDEGRNHDTEDRPFCPPDIGELVNAVAAQSERRHLASKHILNRKILSGLNHPSYTLLYYASNAILPQAPPLEQFLESRP